MGRISHIERSFTTPGTSAYLAHFWVESATLVDAIKRWVAENPSIPGGGDPPHGTIEATSLLMRGAPMEKKAADEAVKKAQASMEKDIPLREMFPGLGEALARTKDPFEALIASSPPGSPARQWVEALRKQVSATGVCIGYTTLADRLVIKSTRDARAEVGARLIESLGDKGENYVAALDLLRHYEHMLRKANQDRPFNKAGALYFHEVMQTLLPLVCLFQSPRHFFNDLLPKVDPKELRRPVIDVLERWGMGALLNPSICAAFLKEAHKPDFSKSLTKLEKRAPFRGAGGAPQGRRPDVRDYRELALTYYALAKPKRSRWLQTEANRKPVITVASLRRLLSKNRPR